MNQQMFSESWHRVATHRAWLQPSVEAQRQTFRGRPWYVLRDPFTNQFYRLPPAAYQFVARLSSKKTIEQVWRECLTFQGEDAPGQEEVIRLLSQLSQANLIVSNLPADSTALFQRFRRNREREQRNRLINFISLKFSLFNPDPFLSLMLPFFKPVLNRYGFMVWAALLIPALAVAATHWDEIFIQGQGLLAPENIFWLYVCGIFVKLWHEFGHGILCRSFGGEVRTCGLMLLVMTPMPFVDVTSSWSFRHRWQRIIVASGGIIFELFLAALAVFVWSHTGRGLANSLAFNVMILSSVTTLAFNANPLLRFDGYYIFSDLLEIPNLGNRSILELRFLLERYLFGCIHSTSPAQSWGEAAWLTGYGIASGLYRIFLIGVILLVLAQHFFAIGLLLSAICLVLWIILPIGRFCRYLWTEPSLERQRWSSIRRVAAVVGCILAFLVLIPFPHHFKAEGIVQARQSSRIYAAYSGEVDRVLVPSGTAVKAGTPLLVMRNPDLDLEINSAQLEVRQAQTKQEVADTEAIVTTRAAQGETQSARDTLHALQEKQRMLTLTAPHDGIWICPQDRELPGGWIDRGIEVGELIDPTQFNFTAIIPQQYADTIFAEVTGAEVRLRGQANHVIHGLQETVIPGKQELLPSAALGWKGGGPVEVAQDDTEGLHAATPFFEVQILLPIQTNAVISQRATGVARFDLAPEPLFFQWLRGLRQLLLSRLQI